MSSSSSSVTSASATDTDSLSFDGWGESTVSLPNVPMSSEIECFEKKHSFGRTRWVIIHATEIKTMVAPFYDSLRSFCRKDMNKPVGYDCEYYCSKSYPESETLCSVQEAFVDESTNTGYCIVIPIYHLAVTHKLASNTLVPSHVTKHIQENMCTFFGNSAANDLLWTIRCSGVYCAFPKVMDFTVVLNTVGVPADLPNTKLYTLAEYYLQCSAPKALKQEFQRQCWLKTDFTKQDVIYAGLDAIISCELAMQRFRYMRAPPRALDSKQAIRPPTPLTAEQHAANVLAYYGQKFAKVPAPTGIPRKMRWIVNCYNGDQANALKGTRNETLLCDVAAIWEKACCHKE